MKVFVTDANERAALAIVRSLGTAGHEVHVGSESGRSIAGASRHARSEIVLPDPMVSPEAFVRGLEDAMPRLEADILIPVSEASLGAALSHRDRLGTVEIPFPSLGVFQAVCDKSRVVKRARDIGVAVPRTVSLRSPAQLAVGELPFQFPVVLKPSRSVVQGAGHEAKLGVVYATRADELVESVERLPPAAYPLLLQEYIQGPGMGVFLLLWDGKLWATFGHRRLREKPPSGGVSVLRESVATDPIVVEQSVALLRSFAWQGVAMIEYKLDRTTGTPYLMEINGRFWGSLQLAVDAGVDFPRLLVSLASGEAVEPVDGYEEGLRLRWSWGAVDNLLARLRGARSSMQELRGSGDMGSRLRACRDFLASFHPSVKSEVFRVSDPLPAVRETIDWFKSAGRA